MLRVHDNEPRHLQRLFRELHNVVQHKIDLRPDTNETYWLAVDTCRKSDRN